MSFIKIMNSFFIVMLHLESFMLRFWCLEKNPLNLHLTWNAKKPRDAFVIYLISTLRK